MNHLLNLENGIFRLGATHRDVARGFSRFSKHLVRKLRQFFARIRRDFLRVDEELPDLIEVVGRDVFLHGRQNFGRHSEPLVDVVLKGALLSGTHGVEDLDDAADSSLKTGKTA